MSKGPDAFRTISEVAEELDLPQHVLRFWETRFPQIKPLKRGGGRRYYRPDDVDLLRGIRQLLYGEGYTIRGVQRILHEQGQRFVVSTGRGEVTNLQAFAVDAEDDQPEPGPALSLGLQQMTTEDEGPAPAFDPREFRSASGNGAHEQAARANGRLASDEVDRLRSTLAELLELKRLLDQAR